MKITNTLYQSGTWLITVYHQHVLIKAAGWKVLEPSKKILLQADIYIYCFNLCQTIYI